MNTIHTLSSLIAYKAARMFNGHSAGEILAEIIRVRLMRINPKPLSHFQSFSSVRGSRIGVIFVGPTQHNLH
jgi:hypothetical protein